MHFEFDPMDTIKIIEHRLNNIPVKKLLAENTKTNHKVNDLQLLRAFCGNDPKTNGSQDKQFSYIKKNRYGGKSHKTSNYTQILLFSEVREHSDAFVWMIETRGTKIRLCNNNTSISDNGIVYIGCIIYLLNPMPINKCLRK